MMKSLAVARKELHQIARDRRTLLILLFVPASFLLLYGYALNFDIRNIRLAVEDRDRTAASRELVSAFVNSGYFDQVADAIEAGSIERLMDRGAIRAALVIPRGFGRELAAGRQTAVQVLINGDNANTATTVIGYATTIVSTVSARHQPRRGLQGMAGQPVTQRNDIAPVLTVEPRVWYNPELQSALFLVPGLIAYIAMITAVVSTALSIVREKERGTIEQIRMAPIGTLSYVIGKTIPYFVISLCSAFLVVLASMALFDLPMRGSWLVLLLAVSLFLAGALGLGLFISTIAESQQVAFQVALIMSFLPTLILSGFIFPIPSMPPAVQAVTYVVPARYFLVALRAIVLKGASIDAFAAELGALALFAAVMLGLSSARLAKQWAGSAGRRTLRQRG